jgi:hypothetical protein
MAGAMTLAACTLTTSLDGFSEPEPAPAPGPEDGGTPPVDAGKDTSVPPDGGGGDADAGSAYAAEVAKDNPLSWWRLGEKSGNVARDEQGVRGGTYVGNVTLGEPGAIIGDPDTAAKLDGTSGCVRIADTFEFEGKATFSIEMWIKPASVGTERRLASRRSAMPESGYRVYFSPTQLRFERWSDGGLSGPSQTMLPTPAKWTHLVATYDGTSTRLWVDGTKADETPSPAPIPSVDAIFVWGSNSFCADDFFAGAMDELAIYDHALSDVRIAAHIKAAGR